MTKTKTPGRLTSALLETADGMKRAGVLDGPTHRKITLRHKDGAKARLRPMSAQRSAP
jgi:hypothetical protein